MVLRASVVALVLSLTVAVLPAAVSAQNRLRQESPEEPARPNFGPGFSERFGRGLLLKKLRTAPSREAVSAARELGRRGDRNAVPELLEYLEANRSGSMGSPAEAVVRALGDIGDRRAVPLLLGLLMERGPLQRAAVRSLGQIGDERALDPIAALLSRPSLRHEAITALLVMGPRVLQRGVALLRDPATAGPACELLGRLRDRRAMWPMVRALDSPRARVRSQCAGALGELGDPRAQRSLYNLLEDPDASVRRRAFAALIGLADGSMGPLLAPLLEDDALALDAMTALRGRAAKAAVPTLAAIAGDEVDLITAPESDLLEQQEAIAALGRIGGPEAAQALAPLMRSRRGDLRYLAAAGLVRLGREHGLAPLLRAARTSGPARVEGLRGLGDLYRPRPLLAERRLPLREVRVLARDALAAPSDEVAAAAAFYLASIRDEDAIARIAELVDGRSSPTTRAAAVTALGWTRSSRACPQVIATLADPVEGVRAAAAWSAGELRCPGAGPTLLAVLEQGPDGAAGNAAWALGAVGYGEAASALRQRLTAGGPALRANAALALAELGDRRAGAIIRGRITRERSVSVRAAMIDALGRLGDPASVTVLEQFTSLPGRSGVLASDGVAAIGRGGALAHPEGAAVFRTRLVDARGEPLGGIWFTLALPDRRIMGGLTDPSGEITVPGLPEGACALGLDRAP